MAEITASMVKELREKTDAPMMECKKALSEAVGDMAKAEEILRVKLGNKASKAAARVTAEGIVVSEIAPGVDIERDILAQAEFPLLVPQPPKLMDAALFQEALLGLAIPRRAA